MAAAGTPVWKIVKIVVIVVIALSISIMLLAFLAQRSISPGSGESSTQIQTVPTTSTLP
jgi:hypothetical protein